MNRVGYLDGLRGLAVMFVFLSHTSGRGQALAPWLDFAGIGHIGVYLFFTLSSFLLGLGLFSRTLDIKALKKFFIKRCLRIAPLYYVVVSGVFIEQLIFGSYHKLYLHISNGWTGYFEHLIFYRGDGVFWSIVSEMQFYLLVPIMVMILIKWRSKGLMFLFLLAGLNAALYLLKFGMKIEWIHYFSPNTLERGTFIDVFIPGLAMAYLVNFESDLLDRYERQIHLWATGIFFVLILVTVGLISNNFLGLERPFFGFRFFSLFFGLVFSLFTYSLYKGNPYVGAVFNFRPLKHIGVIGFSFYLLHFAVLRRVNMLEIASQLKFLLSFTLVVIVATVFFYLIEKPSMNLSHKLISRWLKKSD